MLEKLPEVLGFALRDVRAGLDQIAFNNVGLRSGMGALQVGSLAFQLFALGPGEAFQGTPGRDEVLAAVRERGLSSGCLVGTYQRADGSIQSGEARTGLAGGAATA